LNPNSSLKGLDALLVLACLVVGLAKLYPRFRVVWLNINHLLEAFDALLLVGTLSQNSSQLHKDLSVFWLAFMGIF